MNILVVIEHSQGSIHRLSKEAIVGAQSLGNKVTALVIGERSEKTISFLKGCDIERVLTVPPNCLNNPRWRVFILIR